MTARTGGPGGVGAGALVVAAAALWSLGGVGVKIAHADALVIAGFRALFALVFMGGVLGAQGGLREAAVLVRRPAVWAAAVSYALMVVLFCLAAKRTTAANAIFLQYTAPIWVVLLSGKLLGERPTASDLVAVVACLVGMVLTFGGELGEGHALGNVFALVSGFGFAGLPLFLRVEERRRPSAFAPPFAMCLGNALATLVALPAMVTRPPEDARTWLVLVLLGTVQIGLPYVLYGIAVRRLRALETTLLAMVEPVASPVWVLFATGERPSLMATLGGAIILGTVAVRSALKARR